MRTAPALRRSTCDAALTLAAVAASFVSIAALCRMLGLDGQPAILAAFLAIALSRRARAAHAGGPLTGRRAIVGIAPAAVLTGRLLEFQPLLGASLAVWRPTRRESSGALDSIGTRRWRLRAQLRQRWYPAGRAARAHSARNRTIASRGR